MATPAVTPPKKTLVAGSVATPAPLAKPLPQGVKFDHPVHVRSDGRTRAKDGRIVRRVVMEFLDGHPGRLIQQCRGELSEGRPAG